MEEEGRQALMDTASIFPETSWFFHYQNFLMQPVLKFIMEVLNIKFADYVEQANWSGFSQDHLLEHWTYNYQAQSSWTHPVVSIIGKEQY